MIDRRELDRIAQKARLASAKRPDVKQGLVVMRDCGCIRCGYNLKGLRFEQPCPECATPVNRSITPEDPDAKPWQDASLWRPQWWIGLFGLPEPTSKAQQKPAETKPVVKLCPRCSYDCTSLPFGRPCPECGTARSIGERAAGSEVDLAMQALVRHSHHGIFFALGWGGCCLALAMQWFAFGISASFGDVPWDVTGIYAYAAAAVCSAAATVASFFMLVADPPPDLRKDTAIGTRITAVIASALWSLSCAATAYGFWKGWSIYGVIAAHGAIVVSSLILAFHCRVMFVLAGMVGRSEQGIRAATLGFPLATFVFFAAGVWFAMIGRIPLISFVTCIFVTLFAGVFAFGFFFSNVNIGCGVWWVKDNLDAAADRYERKVERWRERARRDLAHEKRFGNSAKL